MGIPARSTTAALLERRHSQRGVHIDSRSELMLGMLLGTAVEDSSRESPLNSTARLCTCMGHNRPQRSGVGTCYLGAHIESSRGVALREAIAALQGKGIVLCRGVVLCWSKRKGGGP